MFNPVADLEMRDVLKAYEEIREGANDPANAGTSWRVGYTPVHIIHTSVLRNFWRKTPQKWNGVWGDDVDLYDGLAGSHRMTAQGRVRRRGDGRRCKGLTQGRYSNPPFEVARVAACFFIMARESKRRWSVVGVSAR